MKEKKTTKCESSVMNVCDKWTGVGYGEELGLK